MRIYVSSSSVLFANPGQEPIGWNITAPFSFYENTIDGSGFSADMSSIENWAYPIQTNITNSGVIHNVGFLNATEIAMGFAALPPGGCVTSAASGQGVGTASNLWDAPNHRFVGPMRLWQQPESPADRSGLRFRLLHQHLLEHHEWRPGGQVAQPSGEQFFAHNWNVWNSGYTNADPSAHKPNPNYSFETNAYTSILRSQAAKEKAPGRLPDTAGTSPTAGNPNVVGVYTVSKDDYFATFTVAAIANVSLTIGALAPSTIGTSGNDNIVGSGGSDMIWGGCGADWLAGAPLAPN